MVQLRILRRVDTWTLNPAQLGSGAPNGWSLKDPTLGNGGVHPDGSLNNMQAAYDPNTGLVFVNDNVGGSGLWSYDPRRTLTRTETRNRLSLGIACPHCH